MTLRFRISLLVALALTLGRPLAPAARQSAGAGEISADRIRAHVEFLADDLLEGRDTGTRGYDIAAHYAAAVLKGAGFAPGADDGSYFQRVTFERRAVRAPSVALTVGGTTSGLTFPDQVIASPSGGQTEVSVSAPVVFVGTGVSAPRLDHDDYAGTDVTGKIVAVVPDGPESMPSETRAHYSSLAIKADMAAARGAAGIVVLLRPEDVLRTPWEAYKARLTQPSLVWLDPQGRPGSVNPLPFVAVMPPEVGGRLFAGAASTFAATVEAARKPGFRAVPLQATLAVDVRATDEGTITSPNVIGVLRGSDPALAPTSVVLTAHLDHIGISPAGTGDRINNGAYDNAMGSALLLEVARALGALPVRPKRTIVAALVTGEEKGLLGSDYLARFPPRAAGRMVANLNLDMPVFLAASTDIVAFGAEHSSLDATLRSAIAAEGYTLSPDPVADEHVFIRSDQYSFVKQGVPAVMLMPGFTARAAGVNGAEVFGGFLSRHYHRPSDDLSLPMDLAAVARFARANLAITRAIADDPQAPSWNPGDFFGELYGRAK